MSHRFTDPDTGVTADIKDAAKPFKVRVTNKNINEAIQCDACNCAIAQGAKDNSKVETVRIGAGVALVGFKGDKHLTRFILKNTDRRFAKAFDIAKVFLPGTYTLTVPKGSQVLGYRAGSKPGSNVRNGRARTVYNAPQVRGVFWPSNEQE